MMTSNLIFVFTCLILIVSGRILKISLGSIEGKLLRTSASPYGNKTGLVFLGIPYAEPPLGTRRFRDAVPIQNPWKDLLKTQKLRDSCYGDPLRAGGNMSEDCLYLNVFTSDYCLQHKNCSVMLAVHGGSMIKHSPASFDTESIINGFVGRHIIVVSIAYRLGFFGFAHLNGEHGTSADSNVGLTDVLEGLRFLNREVVHFGGDSQKITVYGHSSGAKLLALLSMSSLSTGLFQKQVLMTPGSMLLTKDASTKGTRNVAIRLGCLPETDQFKFSKKQVHDIFSCFRSKTSKELYDAYTDVLTNEPVEFGLPWIDGKVVKGDIEDLLSSDEYERRDSLIGTSVNEVGWSLYAQHKDGAPKVKEIQELCTIIAFEYNYDRPLTTVDKCVEFYSRTPHRASHLVDDFNFVLLSCDLAEDMVRAGKSVFVYSFSYQSDASRLSYEQNPKHADDQNYLFRKIDNPYFTEKDYEIQHTFSGMVASFVSIGDPSPSSEQQWQPFSLENKEFFQIDFDANLTMPGMQDGYYTDFHNFWRVTVPIFGGSHKTLEQYPPSFDVPQLEFYANSKRSLEFNETTTKTLDCRRRAVEEISTFVSQLQRTYRQKNDKGLLTIGAFAVILLIVMFAVSQLC